MDQEPMRASQVAEPAAPSEASSDDEVCASRRTPLLNRKAVRSFTFGYCQRSPRSHVRQNMTRISEDFFEALDVHVRLWIRARVDSQPSKGKTLS